MHDLTDAITEALGVPMVTKWLIIAEAIDDEGEIHLHTDASPGMRQWDARGMAGWVHDTQAPRPVWTDRDDEGDQ